MEENENIELLSVSLGAVDALASSTPPIDY